MSPAAQQTIAKMAAILAPQQTTKIDVNGYTDNTPVGPELPTPAVSDRRPALEMVERNYLELSDPQVRPP